jgi:hypothetical protein
LKSLEDASPLNEEDFTVERVVRGRQADIQYNVTYEARFNTGAAGGITPPLAQLSPDICELTVTVRWNSAAPGVSSDSDYNSEATYTSFVYRQGM